MSLRTRLLLAFAVVVFIPLALLAFGLRQAIDRMSEDYAERLEAVVESIGADLGVESGRIARQLESLKQSLPDDNRFRLAAVAEASEERPYLLDYAESAMRLTGLSMLQIQDGDGRIISSGHFRNEHGRLESALATALSDTKGRPAFVTAHAADRDFIVLARSEAVSIGGRSFTLVGGAEVNDAFLEQLARGRAVTVSLLYPGGRLTSNPSAPVDDELPGDPDAAAAIEDLRFPFLRSAGDAQLETSQATLRITQSRAPLRALERTANVWLFTTAALTGATVLLSVWVSSRISRRLAALAEKTAVLDLDRLDVEFDEGTDEVGRLSQLLGDLAARLRSSTVRVREAERRATIGDLARQINHDIKNGLIPLRNVIRHLTQVGRDDPGALPSVLAERRPTIDSSMSYLETLATNYERLSPAPHRRHCDLNAVVSNVVRGAQGLDRAELRTLLAPSLPRIVGDPVALRRILENLTANAVDSLDSRPGVITISTELVGRDGEPVIRLMVADTGSGMTREQSEKIFTDFYTTKPGGTGLGLSIVRRLVMDLQGTIRVESAAGEGTRMIVEIPARNPGGRDRDSAGREGRPYDDLAGREGPPYDIER